MRVYLQPDLHAKIYLLGRSSIVGSSNLSKSSRDSLDEAALLTTDNAVARRLKQWFSERVQAPVTPGWLSHCQKIYRPAHDMAHRGRTAGMPVGRGIWLLGIRPVDYPESEKPAFKSGEKIASVRLQNSRRYSVDSVRWTGKEDFQRGDLVVQIWQEGKTEVHPHATLLNIKRIKTNGKTQAAYLYLEMPKKFKAVRWPKFKDECRKVGLKLNRRIKARHIRNRVQANKIKSMMSPEKIGLL